MKKIQSDIRAKSPFFLILLFLALLHPLQALTLEETVFYALKTNPDILQKQKRLKGLNEDKDIARSGFLPKLDVSSGYGFAQEEITPSYRISGEAVQRVDTYALASLNLFNGFGTINEMRAQKHRVTSGDYNLLESQGIIALKTIEAYIAMMKQKAILKISHENV
ncbi:MAG: TolC family protein, partial [Thiovulaceae bacterium]|nr:TolC family protein [Sulfurimonadaceae bacterium]